MEIEKVFCLSHVDAIGTIAANLPGTQTSYAWQAGETLAGTAAPGAHYRVRVTAMVPAGGPETAYYFYDSGGRLLAEYDGAGARVKDYLYLGGKMIGEYQPATGAYYYYASDQINSTRLVTDSTGAVVRSAQYDPYGGLYKTWVDAYHPKPGFSGKERESGSGMDYFGARYYSHKLYRFISVDPIVNKSDAIVNPLSWNLYMYCRSNPITFLDPDGKDSILGINSDVRPGVNLISAGHAWISVLNLNNLEKTTYGLWPDSHPYAVDNGPNSDVRTNIEKQHNYRSLYKRYYFLDEEGEKRVIEFVEKSKEWSKRYNCSDWAVELVENVIGQKISIKEYGKWGTPRRLSKEIIKLNKTNDRSTWRRESDIVLKENK